MDRGAVLQSLQNINESRPYAASIVKLPRIVSFISLTSQNLNKKNVLFNGLRNLQLSHNSIA